MYPAPLHKIPTQTIVSWHFLERWILQNQPTIINKMIKKVGTKTQLKIWNRFVPYRLTIFSLVFCRQRQVYLDWFYISDQSSVLYAHFLNKESWKKLESLRKIWNRRYRQYNAQNKKFTTLNAAFSSYQIIWPRALLSEVWSCVWMGNLNNKSTILHERDLALWDSHDLPSFPPSHPLNCHESCIFFVRFAKYSPFTSPATMLGSSL